MPTDRKMLGAFGEKVTKGYLGKRGYETLETNFRCSAGEIDIMARQKGCLVFVEVRTRRSLECGTPEESATPAKREKLIELAQAHIQKHQDLPSFWRMDVVAIEVGLGGKVT